MEIDARLSIFSYYFCNDYNILYKRLTKYVKSDHSISSNYKKFSINWWNKRKEAFDFLKITLKNKKIYFVKSYDYYLTNLIYFFIKKNLIKMDDYIYKFNSFVTSQIKDIKDLKIIEFGVKEGRSTGIFLDHVKKWWSFILHRYRRL